MKHLAIGKWAGHLCATLHQAPGSKFISRITGVIDQRCWTIKIDRVDCPLCLVAWDFLQARPGLVKTNRYWHKTNLRGIELLGKTYREGSGLGEPLKRVNVISVQSDPSCDG